MSEPPLGASGAAPRGPRAPRLWGFVFVLACMAMSLISYSLALRHTPPFFAAMGAFCVTAALAGLVLTEFQLQLTPWPEDERGPP